MHQNHPRVQKQSATVVLFFIGSTLILLAWISITNSYRAKSLSLLSYFTIRHLRIDVTDPLTSSDIKAYLPSIIGKNLMTISSSMIRQTLLGQPSIQSVMIKKLFSEKTLWIQVTPRIPKALWHSSKEKMAWIDSDGVIFTIPHPLTKHYLLVIW